MSDFCNLDSFHVIVCNSVIDYCILLALKITNILFINIIIIRRYAGKY